MISLVWAVPDNSNFVGELQFQYDNESTRDQGFRNNKYSLDLFHLGTHYLKDHKKYFFIQFEFTIFNNKY